MAEDHHADAAEGVEAEPRGPQSSTASMMHLCLLLDLVPELLVE